MSKNLEDKIKSSENFFSKNFSVGNNEKYVEFLKKEFSEDLGEQFQEIYAKKLEGDLKSFSPKDTLNQIALEAAHDISLYSNNAFKHIANIEFLKDEILAKQAERSQIPSDYVVMEFKSNNDIIYADYVLNKDGINKMYDGTIATHETAYLENKILVTQDEYDSLLAEYMAFKYPKIWKQVSEDRYDDMLCVLPPINHKNIKGTTFFQMSEREMGNITKTFAHKDGNYFESFQKTNVDFNELKKDIDKLQKHLLTYKNHSKIVFMNQSDNSHEFGKIRKAFVAEIGAQNDWAYVEMNRLYDDQMINGINYLENYSIDGVFFTLIKPDSISDEVLEETKEYFRKNRDSLGFAVIAYGNKTNSDVNEKKDLVGDYILDKDVPADAGTEQNTELGV
ncbi:MAG: hypothetical protein RBR02_09335 [Desulfuromonadaceae bacterium]|nr:hypothetical protein [Desulfuromonadaceae bacterium]